MYLLCAHQQGTQAGRKIPQYYVLHRQYTAALCKAVASLSLMAWAEHVLATQSKRWYRMVPSVYTIGNAVTLYSRRLIEKQIRRNSILTH